MTGEEECYGRTRLYWPLHSAEWDKDGSGLVRMWSMRNSDRFWLLQRSTDAVGCSIVSCGGRARVRETGTGSCGTVTVHVNPLTRVRREWGRGGSKI